MQTRSLPNGGWCVALRSILFVAILTLLSSIVSAAALTPATGGSAISADTANGTFTALIGPLITENLSGDINVSIITLRAPQGFAFDVNATVRAIVTRTGGSGQDNRNINHAANNTALIPDVTAETITLNITHASKHGVTNAIAWHNISIRPTAGTPLANGSITLETTTVIADVANGSAAGTLAETTGALAALALTPANATIAQNGSQQYAAALTDQFGNVLDDATATTNLSANVAGNWTNTTFSTTLRGIWTIAGAWNAFNATAMLTVLDITPPVLTLLGHNPAEVDEGKAYGDYGYTASDNTDGTLDGAVTVTGSVDTDRPGTYALTYTVNDSSGNNASATRTVIVREDTGGNRRGREFSHFAAQAAPASSSTAPSSAGTSGGTAAGAESAASAGASEASAGEESAETSSAEVAAPVASESVAPRNEMPGTIEDGANTITGAVTGTQRSTTWLWIASTGLLVAGLLAVAGKYRNRKPDFSP